MTPLTLHTLDDKLTELLAISLYESFIRQDELAWPSWAKADPAVRQHWRKKSQSLVAEQQMQKIVADGVERGA